MLSLYSASGTVYTAIDVATGQEVFCALQFRKKSKSNKLHDMLYNQSNDLLISVFAEKSPWTNPHNGI